MQGGGIKVTSDRRNGAKGNVTKGTAPKQPRSLADLVLDAANANRGTERGGEALRHSLKKLGAGRSVVLDRLGRVIAGNKTVENARALGMNDLIIVRTDGKQIVAVQRTDLDLETDPNARELAVADNRVGELNLAWAGDVLNGMTTVDLLPYFTVAELQKLLPEKADAVDEGAEPKVEVADELQRKWKTETGQIWEVPAHEQGAHRVMCGDSTSAVDVAALMKGDTARMVFTDPPWNVAIGLDSNPQHRQREGLKNDDLPQEEFASFLRGFIEQTCSRISGDLYVVMSSSQWPTIDSLLRTAGLHWSSTIVWVKDSFVMGRSNYQRRFEPLWYGWSEKGKSSYNHARDLDDVWEIPRPKVSEAYPTMKPVALPFRAIRNSSLQGDLVYEPFVGGGSTIVAADQLGRRCYAMDKDPKYVAVTLQRLHDNGLRPKLLR